MSNQQIPRSHSNPRVDLGRQHLPRAPAQTPNRESSFVWTPDHPSPQRVRDVNANLNVPTNLPANQQRTHSSPLGRVKGDLPPGGGESQQRTHSSPLRRTHNININTASQQLVASSSLYQLHSSPSNKKGNKKGKDERGRCGRCKHPLDHRTNTDASVVNNNEEHGEGEKNGEEGDDEKSDESEICECYERKQREMENRRNSWVEGEDPHAASDEEEFLSWLHGWCSEFEED